MLRARLTSAEALFWLATCLYMAVWAANDAALYGTWEAHQWLKPLPGPVRAAAAAALVNNQVADPHKLLSYSANRAFQLLPAVPFLATFRWKGALTRTLLVAGLQSLLLELALFVPTDLPRYTTAALSLEACLVVALGTLVPAVLLTKAIRTLLPGRAAAPWAVVGLLAVLSRYNFLLPERWLLDPVAWQTLAGSPTNVARDLAWNRLFWLAVGLAAVGGSLLLRRVRLVELKPSRWRELLPAVLTCLVVAAIELYPLWGERTHLVAPGDNVDILRRYPAAIFVCAVLAARRVHLRRTFVAVGLGVFVAVLTCRFLDPNDLAWSFVTARIGFDLLAWFLMLGLLGALAFRWPTTDAPLVVGCFALIVSDCLPGPLYSWSFLVRFPRLAYSQLGGLRWSLDGVLPSTLYGTALVVLLILCIVARGGAVPRLSAVALTPVVAALGIWCMRLDRSGCPGGIWSGSAQPLWGIVYQATHDGWLDQPQPKIIRGRVTVDIGSEGTRVSVSGQFVLKNQTKLPLTKVVVSIAPEAEDVHLALSGETLQVTRYNAVEAELSPPLSSGDERPLTFGYTFRQSVTHQSMVELDGSVLLFTQDARQSSAGLLPWVGIGPFDLKYPPYSRAPAVAWSDVRVPEESNQGAYEDSAAFDLEVELRTQRGWHALTSGEEIARRTEGSSEIALFRSPHATNNGNIIVAAGRYQVAKGAAGATPISVFTASGRSPEIGEALLRAATEILPAEAAILGDAPIRSLVIAEASDYQLSQQYAGKAYPGVVLIGEAVIRRWAQSGDDHALALETLAHEMAHQWTMIAAASWSPEIEEGITDAIALQWLRGQGDVGGAGTRSKSLPLVFLEPAGRRTNAGGDKGGLAILCRRSLRKGRLGDACGGRSRRSRTVQRRAAGFHEGCGSESAPEARRQRLLQRAPSRGRPRARRSLGPRHLDPAHHLQECRDRCGLRERTSQCRAHGPPLRRRRGRRSP